MVVQRQFQRVINVVVIGPDTNEMGGTDGVVLQTWKRRADIEDKSGYKNNSYFQELSVNEGYLYVRHERTRPIQNNYYLEYEGQWMKVESVNVQSERFKLIDKIKFSYVDMNVTLPEAS